MIVTTADLKIAQFDPGMISLADGTLPGAKIQSVPYIRFRKQMSVRERRFTPEDFEREVRPDKAKEHTVFVVRADALLDFLKAFELPGDTLREFAS